MSLDLRSALTHPTPAVAARVETSAQDLVPFRPLRIVLSAAGAQFLVLLALNTLQWQRDALTYDFSLFGQAGWLIAHGHLDPHSSLIGMSFIRNDAELLFWPIALLAAPFGGTPFALLVLEDAALAATSALALLWIGEVLERHRHRVGTYGRLLWLLGLAAVVLDPWCYETALFPFHLEAFAGLFTILAARQLWRGARWPFLVWCLALAATGTAGVIEMIGMGVAALLVTRRRIAYGIGVIVSGTLLLQVLTQVGLVAQNGAGAAAFAYLAPGTRHPGLVGIAVGMFTHILALGHVAVPRLPILFAFLLPVGFLGVLHRMVIAPVAAVLLPPLLAEPGRFFRIVAAFQLWPVLLLVTVGSIEMLACFAGRLPIIPRRSDAASRTVCLSPRFRLGWIAVWMTSVLVSTATVFAGVSRSWAPVTPATAGTLTRIAGRLPRNTEVVVSQGVVGRFATRRWTYAITASPERFPVHAREVVFVFTNQGIRDVSPRVTAAMVSTALHLRGASSLVTGHGVTAIRWRPPRSVSSIVLPATKD